MPSLEKDTTISSSGPEENNPDDNSKSVNSLNHSSNSGDETNEDDNSCELQVKESEMEVEEEPTITATAKSTINGGDDLILEKNADGILNIIVEDGNQTETDLDTSMETVGRSGESVEPPQMQIEVDIPSSV